MMIPSQGMTVLADMGSSAQKTAAEIPESTQERIEETLPLEQVANADETEHIQETLPLEPLEGNTSLDGITAIYWNPGGSLPEELLATASNAAADAEASAVKLPLGIEKATPSNVAAGSDKADGLTPQHPVKSLEAAYEKADELAENQGIEPYEITIYAMNPMEIPDGRMYVLNGGSAVIESWPGRTYHNDTIFFLNGGQLTLNNVILQGGSDRDPDDTELVSVYGGGLQLGKNVTIDGRIVMDYRSRKEDVEWATASNATASDAEAGTEAGVDSGNGQQRAACATASGWTENSESQNGAGFDIDDYIFSEDEYEWELMEDRTSASTWKDPIIELIDGFEGLEEGYLLEIRSDASDREMYPMVKTLYADEMSEEEYAGYFRLAESVMEDWEILPIAEVEAVIRDTSMADRTRYRSMMLMADLNENTEEESTAASKKTLYAARTSRAAGGYIYWNPGPDSFKVDGITYTPGDDTNADGSTPDRAFRSWTLAVSRAANQKKTIICMQSVELGSANADLVLPPGTGSSMMIESPGTEYIVTVIPWSSNLNPIFVVPAGETIELRNIRFGGIERGGKEIPSQSVYSTGGQIVIHEGVTADNGYIQIDADVTLKNRPVQVTSIDGGMVTLYFGGINTNLSYRYTDVVVPAEALANRAGVDAASADAVGKELLGRFKLQEGNLAVEQGGNSKFGWKLRQDSLDDPQDGVHPENLELYADYYYEAVYLDGIRGNDTYNGATCQVPVRTWDQAKLIWNREMTRALTDRAAARAEGRTEDAIAETIPLPLKIYICGTVTVADAQNWQLETVTDNGIPYRTEVVSHNVPALVDGSTTEYVHPVPGTLIEVTGAAAALSLKDVTIRNITDEKESISIEVKDGAALRMSGSTELTGTREVDVPNMLEAKELTKGIHIKVVGGAKVTLDDTWTGNIGYREQGLVADGAGTRVTMDGGSISHNNAFDEKVAHDDQKKGAGVSLTGGAAFTMNGGSIAENKVYSTGGGVYADGAGTAFTMNKGSVTGNVMARTYRIEYDENVNTNGDSWYLQGAGIGIYGGEGTIINIGKQTNSLVTDALVSDNAGRLTDGAGIYAAGSLHISNAAVSGNTGDTRYPDSTGTTRPSINGRGGGIHVAPTGTLTMADSQIIGNGAALKAGGTVSETRLAGGGLYLAEGSTGNTVKNSLFSANQTGFNPYNGGVANTGGGAVYMNVKSDLVLEECEVKENQGTFGGGVLVYSNSASYRQDTKLKITGGSFHDNRSTGTNGSNGQGGALNAYQSTVEVDRGTRFYGNTSRDGGSVYGYYCAAAFLGTEDTPLEIYDNHATNNGGGIYLSSSGTNCYFKYVKVHDNEADAQGGGVYNNAQSAWYECEFDRNTSAYTYPLETASAYGGGGICAYSLMYLTNCRIRENRSTFGGGIYVYGTIQINEDSPGRSSISGNEAIWCGGAIYNAGTSMFDLSSEMKNKAGKQGSNLYHKQGTVQALSGDLAQPDAGDGEPGVYNVYVEGTNNAPLYLNPNKVMIEKKAGLEADAIRLERTNGYLVLYESPVDPAREVLPVDVNTELFAIGSLVAKPYGYASIGQYKVYDEYKPGAGTYAQQVYVHTTSFSEALMNASLNIPYFEGGTKPRRTQLGGFRDSADTRKTNLVLLGEGVYLDGTNGSPANHGTSPDDAVDTFEKAKEILEGKIRDKAADEAGKPEEEREGYTPYIYLCGKVEVPSGEHWNWELDYTDPLYTDTNKAFEQSEKLLDNWKEGDNETNYKAQIRRFASFINQPMIQMGKTSGSAADAGSLTLKTILINGMNEAVMTNSQGGSSPIIRVGLGSELQMEEQAVLCNNYYQIVDLYGRLVMKDQAKIRDCDGRMVYVRAANASIEMNDSSSIALEEGRATKIQSTSYFSGIYIDSSYSSEGLKVTVDLNGNSFIGRANAEQPAEALYYGIRVSSGANVDIHMNTNPGAKDDDSAKIMNCAVAISLNGRGRQNVAMKKRAALENNTSYGFHINKNLITADMEEKVTLIMGDNSSIVNTGGTGFGIYIEYNYQPIEIVMEDHAVIGGFNYGIYGTGSSYGIKKLELTMRGQSSISGNASYGIYANYNSTMKGSEGDYFRITMEDYATVGAAYAGIGADGRPDRTTVGDEGENGSYVRGKLRSGNKTIGIYSYLPAQITMSDWAAIRYNGTSAIYTTRYTSSSYYYSNGTGTLKMSDDSSIDHNGYSSYSVQLYQTGTSYPNPWEITMTGRAAITDNRGYVTVNPDSVLKLQEYSRIGKAQDSLNAIEMKGSLELAGTSIVGDIQEDGSTTGQIYLIDGQKPITMTSPASGNRAYHLKLAESFVGQTVVKPGGSMTTLNSPSDPQLKYFYKDVGVGLAADKSLKAQGTDIILAGENNVFLSDSGNDANNGVTPSTPVRTFRQAKWLLENGDFTEGANILICRGSSGYAGVNVEKTDTEWAFDAGGTVTNIKSHQTWKPVVTRYKTDYSYGRLITVKEGITVDFHDITIDGGYPEGSYISNTAPSEMMMVFLSSKAVLGENCILQNNRIGTNNSHYNVWDPTSGSSSGNVYNPGIPGIRVLGGTLEINGATLQGLERRFYSSISSGGSAYGYQALASAVSVEDFINNGLPYQGRVIMNSGRIENNRVTTTYGGKKSYYSAGAVVACNGGEFVMNGGTITENEFDGINTEKDRIQGGGGLVVHNAGATINGGNIRGNTGYRGSNIFYYDDDTGTDSSRGMFLVGGQIRDGQVVSQAPGAVAAYSPVYVAGGNFQLAGGGCDVKDPIYLDSDRHIVKVSSSIYQTGRRYRIHINRGNGANQFRKGSAVVQPDGDYLRDVSGYLGYFEVASAPYILDAGEMDSRPAGTVAGMTEERCLILRKAVYINGSDDPARGGNDANDGLVPLRAVRTFERAKECGETDFDSRDPEEIRDYYVIYVCGEVNNGSSSVWKLSSPAYMCRYTGFQTYDQIGNPEEPQSAYYGVLVRPDTDLTLEEFAIYGRRAVDTTAANGSSLFEIETERTLTVPAGAAVIMGRNNNTGTYTDITTGIQHAVSEKGGAVLVRSGGTFDMRSGSISNTAAGYGNAIYLEADDELDAGSYQFGHLKLSGSLNISGSVYLDGSGTATSAYIEADGSYQPPVDADGNATTPLMIEMGNDHGGRDLVHYPAGMVPGDTELGYYDFADAVKAIYDVVSRAGAENVLELEQRLCFYLDGQHGSNANDGLTPETAFRTLEKVYEAISREQSAGVMVYVVDTLEVTGSESPITLGNTSYTNPSTGISSYQGFYEQGATRIDIEGQVYFKRYAQPSVEEATPGTLPGFAKETLLEPLFAVEEGGVLTLNGIYVDGHSQPSAGNIPQLVAPAVEAKAPLIRVQPGGKLECGWIEIDPAVNPNYTATYTLLTNNKNVSRKEETAQHYIGDMKGIPIYEGSGAGIELIGDHTASDYGTVATHVAMVTLKQTQFRNLELGAGVAGGADVYSDGELHVSNQVSFSGSVFMEGIGSTDEPEKIITSRYIWADTYGTPIKTQFALLVRDPYEGRVIQRFPDSDIIRDNEISSSALFRLEEDVTEFFYVGRDEAHKYQFILSVPTAVYIDGINGDDDNENALAGSTPKNPVRTLRRAYELLQGRAGYTIYVVNAIQIDASTTLTGTSYKGADGSIDLLSTNKVQIMRYMQPDFAVADPAEALNQRYNVADYNGPLICVGGGTGTAVTLTMADNILINGHSEDRDSVGYPYQVVVTEANHGGTGVQKALESKAPLIVVEEDSTLQMNPGTLLTSNNNTYDEEHDTPQGDVVYAYGGAIHNSGTVNVNGVEIRDNSSKYGSIAYQNGEFKIESGIGNILDDAAGAQNSFYLTTDKRGTNASGETVWGTDHILKSQVAMPDGEAFHMEMDRAAAGRDVIQFTDAAAYAPEVDADAEHEHFLLGNTVPEELFLVVAESDPGVLELQDWKIVKAEVPKDIYLVVTRKGTIDSSTKLNGILDRTAELSSSPKLFSSPEYQIVNKGRYDMKVSLQGVVNDNTTAGITDEVMSLKERARDVIGEKDIYLAIKGLDTDSTDGLTAEIPLTEKVAAPSELGYLKAGSTGAFEITGNVGVGFVDKYKDLSFPLTDLAEDVQEYMDGSNPDGVVHAKAKYILKYKVEMVPPRRQPVRQNREK